MRSSRLTSTSGDGMVRIRSSRRSSSNWCFGSCGHSYNYSNHVPLIPPHPYHGLNEDTRSSPTRATRDFIATEHWPISYVVRLSSRGRCRMECHATGIQVPQCGVAEQMSRKSTGERGLHFLRILLCSANMSPQEEHRGRTSWKFNGCACTGRRKCCSG